MELYFCSSRLSSRPGQENFNFYPTVLVTASGCTVVVFLRNKFGNLVGFGISLLVNFWALSQKYESDY